MRGLLGARAGGALGGGRGAQDARELRGGRGRREECSGLRMRAEGAKVVGGRPKRVPL